MAVLPTDGAETLTVGATVSTTTLNAPDTGLTLPAASEATAVMTFVPVLRGLLTLETVQTPFVPVTALPTGDPPLLTVTVEPASAVPEMDGVFVDVMPSLEETPKSGE